MSGDVRQLCCRMAIKLNNWMKASISGWIGCCIGILSIFGDVLSACVLTKVGTNPGTMTYVLLIAQAGFLTLIVGMPLGVYACFRGRKGLGTFAIISCLPAIIYVFIR